MLTTILVGLLLLQSQAGTPPSGGVAAGKSVGDSGTSSQQAEPAAAKPETIVSEKLLRVKRIYVDTFGDDDIGKQIQAMIINSLTDSKRFIVTENKEKADAILKGTALEKTSQEYHASSEGTAVGGAAGHHSGRVSGSVVNGSGSVSGSSQGGFAARSAAISDSSASTETINDARGAVRLVDSNGDVIWATTQESKGAKYKGASADVADKIVKQLLRDFEKLEKKSNPSPMPNETKQ
jgi:curli biogenesis system outer membrane secretion channel CsgG